MILPLGVVGVIYFLIRLIGKYVGAYLGAKVAGSSDLTKKYMGLGLVPQAGVAIGLAALGARILGGEMGDALSTIIIASSVLYELVGPTAAKFALYKTGSYSTKIEEVVKVKETDKNARKKTDIELLIERIQKIKGEVDNMETTPSQEEIAFTEAAEETPEILFGRTRRGIVKNNK